MCDLFVPLEPEGFPYGMRWLTLSFAAGRGLAHRAKYRLRKTVLLARGRRVLADELL